jgi:chromosome segregation protein
MTAWRDRVQVIEQARGGFREQAHEMETLLATLDVKRNNLEERIEEQYKGRYQDLMASLDPQELPRELEIEEGVFQLDQAEALLEQKREKINSLGPINHLALEEYETKKERLDFLEQQRDDVEKARDDLVKAIGEINRTAKKRFVDTFEEVRRNYIAVFQTLFKGGRADLQLVRTDDPLESHIHVTAQPTGKVVDTVSLLSGGERCLTALSLLFAVYLVKPSPFCMLDEADAPLDDANIGRFVNMLREFSRSTQFLVITHNKLTMETANHLYGVTMMEPGCSSIVSVSFHDVAQTQSDQDLGDAIAEKRRAVDETESQRVAEAPAGTPGQATDADDDERPAMEASQ